MVGVNYHRDMTNNCFVDPLVFHHSLNLNHLMEGAGEGVEQKNSGLGFQNVSHEALDALSHEHE